MNANVIHRDLVHSIVGAFHAVYNYYDHGLVESIYCGALEYELADRGHRVAREVAVAVEYKGRHVGWQRLDMLVDQKVVVEVKAGELLPKYAARQVLSYLRVSTCQVGLVLHFGPEPKFERYVDTRARPVMKANPPT